MSSAAMSPPARVAFDRVEDGAELLVGTVGYCPFLRSYPLGPELIERICAPPWPAQAAACDLSWGPVAIVQEFQAAGTRPRRVVLVAAVDRGLPVGSVSCRRWLGGRLSPAALQERMFEAVTGVVHLDNLLAIGDHFGIWPDEVFTVEAQLASTNLGDYVLQAFGETGTGMALGERALEPALLSLVERMATLTRRALFEGAAGLPDLLPLATEQLAPVKAMCYHRTATGVIRYPAN